MINKILFFVFFVFLSCSKDGLNGKNILDKIENEVWTRGNNYKVFKNNPFRLILVEDGICNQFSEEPKIINGNEFHYSLLENGKDTLRLKYRVTGEKVNHSGTFTYYIDTSGELIRDYVESNTFYTESYSSNFYRTDKSLSILCPDL